METDWYLLVPGNYGNQRRTVTDTVVRVRTETFSSLPRRLTNRLWAAFATAATPGDGVQKNAAVAKGVTRGKLIN